MSSKFYAVRVGVCPGIYRTWDECKANTHGFPCSEYKSFKTLSEAEQFMNRVSSDYSKEDEKCVVAYVDGSYDSNTKRYAFGCVIVAPGMENVSLNGVGDDADAVSARNVAGELLGTMKAVMWADSHGYKDLIIYHDYTGIQKWFDGEWRAESFVSVKYTEFMNEYKGKLNISFRKVAAHTGIELNEKADELAKAALGIEK